MDPESVALSCGWSAEVNASIAAPSVDIEICNNTGGGTFVVNYGPVRILFEPCRFCPTSHIPDSALE